MYTQGTMVTFVSTAHEPFFFLLLVSFVADKSYQSDTDGASGGQ